ncbi:MAG: TlpA family protein disulfide reductase [Treponema sp.]|jgi:peroxiredoxin|nr:TlpA family protein disulfide reductase [Treponema sp.]
MNHIARKNRNQGKTIFCAGIMLVLSATLSVQGAERTVGQTAPDFTFTTPEGKPMKLSSYRGKPVALHFWTTWCGPCIRELPLISALTQAKAQELTVLAVNCAETEQTVASFLGRNSITLNVVMDQDSRISRLYAIDAIPQTYLIDAEGIIRSIRVGAYTRGELNRDISALLGR